MFVSSKHVEELLKEDAHVFTIFAALGIDNKVTMEELGVVCDFPKVFSDDISDLPPEHDVEFSIDLVPSIFHVSVAPYRMTASELSELKKQLEEFLEKRFV